MLLVRIIVRITKNFLNGRSDLLIIEDVRKEYVRISGKLVSGQAFRSKIRDGEYIGVLRKIPVERGKLVRASSETVDYVSGVLKEGDKNNG